MSLINAADMPDHQMVSVVIPSMKSDYQNHSPLSVLDVTQDGQAFEIHIYRGKKFSDENGETFTPLGYLSNDEYFTLRTMLEHTDENGVFHKRVLPYPWEEIAAMIIAMRKAAAQQSQPTEELPDV